MSNLVPFHMLLIHIFICSSSYIFADIVTLTTLNETNCAAGIFTVLRTIPLRRSNAISCCVSTALATTGDDNHYLKSIKK